MLEHLRQKIINLLHKCPEPVIKQEPVIQTLEALISDYNREDLANALDKLQFDLGWKVFRAALIKEYLNKSLETMEYSKETGKQIEAAHSSGCAYTLYDTATALIEKYKDLLQNKSQVVTDPPPER